MAFDYQPLADTAARLIADFGRPITLRRSDSAAPPDPLRPFEPAAPSHTPGPHHATVKGVQSSYSASERALGTIEDKDVRFLLSPDGAPPDLGTEWELVDGEVDYQIVNVREVKPGPVVIYYDVQARI